MISVNDQVFRLDTRSTTYAFRISEGYPEHLYYGRRVVDTDFTAVAMKNTIDLGSTVKTEGSSFFLERNLLEFSVSLTICFAFLLPSSASFCIFASLSEIMAISLIAKNALMKIRTNTKIMAIGLPGSSMKRFPPIHIKLFSLI